MPNIITITRLSLTNYRNYGSADFAFDGKSGQICGANMVGKTNALEAIEWVLTDKLLGGSSDVAQIKPLRDTKAKATAELALDADGKAITLLKEFYEKWVRHAKSAEATMEGHCTDYTVNGAKMPRLKDFQQSLEDKIGVRQDQRGLDAIQLLTDPFYLARLCNGNDWKIGRQFIIDLVGDVTPEDVYKKNPASANAKGFLEKHDYDDGEALKEIMGLIKQANVDQISAQGAVDEHRKVAAPDAAQVVMARQNIEEIERRAAHAENGDTVGIDAEINALGTAYNEAMARYNATLAPKQADHAALDAAQKASDEAHKALRGLGWAKDAEATEGLIKETNETLDGFRKQLIAIKKDMAEYEPTGSCPVCKRPYDKEHLEQERKDFMAHKTAEGDAVMAKGIQAKKDLEGLEKRLAEEKAFNDDLLKKKASLEKKAQEADEALDEARRQYQIDCQPTPNEAIKAEADAIMAKISAKRQERGDLIGRSGQAVAQIKAEAEPWREVVRQQERWEDEQTALKDAESRLAKAQQAQADAEGAKAAVDLYVRTKLEMLDENVARVFGGIRFQLVRPNIKSGSYDEVCEPYVYDLRSKKSKAVLWSSGSKSEQIATGCAIIKAIREAKNWPSLPVVFDEGGEMDKASLETLDREIGSQIISAKVDDAFAKPTFVARQ